MTQIHKHEQAILHRLINGSDEVEGIKDMKNVTLHFAKENGPNQDLILALTFNNLSSKNAVKKYSENSILVYDRQSSNHYSKRILDSVNLESIVRVSPLHCHNKKDVDLFLKITKEFNYQ